MWQLNSIKQLPNVLPKSQIEKDTCTGSVHRMSHQNGNTLGLGPLLCDWPQIESNSIYGATFYIVTRYKLLYTATRTASKRVKKNQKSVQIIAKKIAKLIYMLAY